MASYVRQSREYAAHRGIQCGHHLGNCMGGEPTGYDREWTTPIGPKTRQRLGYSHDHGAVTKFVVQLEYRLRDGWATVVRYDHDREGDHSHDVEKEGLHIDIYRDGEKHVTEYITGPLPPGLALDLAEEHLAGNAERFIRRFERWHLK